MRRICVLGVLAFGLLGLAQGQNGQGQNGNGQGQNSAPEPAAMELPLFLLGAASLALWRHYRSKSRTRVNPGQE